MSDLAELASKLFSANPESRPKIAGTEKRVRGVLNGKYIFDTTAAKLVWENGFYPLYWIPKSDFLETVKFADDKPVSGINSSTSTLSVDNKSVASLVVPDSFNSELAGYVKIDFKALEAWYEEQAEVVYHPKDPFHRVDVIPSGRHVKVEIDGVSLADTGSEGGVMSLWETRFPARWYLPRTAIKWEHLTPSDTHTGCPYKGEASYYNAVINGKEIKDVAWWYKNPIQESAGVIGMLCFYPNKVDTWVDGKEIEKIGMPIREKPKEEKKSCTATKLPPTPQSFTENHRFLPILHSVISENASSDPEVQSQAAVMIANSGASFLQTVRRQQTGSGASDQGGYGSGGRGGWVHVSDQRRIPDFGRIPDPEDIFGSVEVDGQGKFVDGHGRYQPSGTYRICTNDGILVLTDFMRKKLVERLKVQEAAEKGKK